MHSNLFILVWRRKLSILLISSSFVLLTLWTWAFFNSNYTDSNQTFNAGANQNEYLIQKLISQANRVLKYQRQFLQSGESRGKVNSNPSLASGVAVGAPQTKQLGILRPTRGSASVSQSLSSAGRRKKAPIVGESFLFEDERLKILQNQQRGQSDDNTMDYERIVSSAERQSQYEHELQRMGVPIIAGIGPGGPQSPAERLVHLDLKGAAPKLSFLKRLLPIIKTLGGTGLLIEYEDMFPFSGSIQALSAKNAYKPDELKDFLESATMHGLTIMPLVQTFGHMEFALKLQGFEHMREIPESPQSICPSQKVSMSFIEELVTQMIEFHLKVGHHFHSQSHVGNISENNGGDGDGDGDGDGIPIKFTHIHIGCDEVARMGECDKCRQHSRNELFLNHVTTVANFIRTKWPNLKVVIWDDMLRDMMLSEMLHSQIGNYVEPMIWVYANDIYRFIHSQLWDMYSKVFPTAWAASAFKGAFGESLMIPPIQRHLENNIRWLAVIAKEGTRFSKGFKGLALTGWQRYDHFAVLCELLPTGMPSLITSLATVSRGYFSIDPKDNDILRVLECAFHPDSRRSGHPWIEFHPNSHHSQLFSSCTYAGSLVYKFTLRLFDKLLEVQNYLLHVQGQSAWMSDYNNRHNFSSPLRVRELTANTPRLIDDLTIMAKEAHSVMYEVFDEHTIAEFIEQNIFPSIVSLRKQIEIGEQLLKPNVWPQRPLPYSRELIAFNLIPDSNDIVGNQQQQQQQQHPH